MEILDELSVGLEVPPDSLAEALAPHPRNLDLYIHQCPGRGPDQGLGRAAEDTKTVRFQCLQVHPPLIQFLVVIVLVLGVLHDDGNVENNVVR